MKSHAQIIQEVLNAPKHREAEAIQRAVFDLLGEDEKKKEDGDKEEVKAGDIAVNAIAFDDPTYPFIGAGRAVRKKGSGYAKMSFGNVSVPVQSSLLK